MGHFTVGCVAGEFEAALIELLVADELATVLLTVDLPARDVVSCARPGFAAGLAAAGAPDCAGYTPAAAGSFGVPARFPVDEFSAMTNLSGHRGTVSTLRSAVRPLRYPVQQYRCSPVIREDASSARKQLGLRREMFQLCACLRDIRSHTGSGLCGLRGRGGISGMRKAIRKRQASSFAKAATTITIPEKPNSPDKIAADKKSKDQCCIVFRMAFAQRDRRVLRLVTTAITTNALSSMAVAAKVRLSINICNSRTPNPSWPRSATSSGQNRHSTNDLRLVTCPAQSEESARRPSAPSRSSGSRSAPCSWANVASCPAAPLSQEKRKRPSTWQFPLKSKTLPNQSGNILLSIRDLGPYRESINSSGSYT